MKMHFGIIWLAVTAGISAVTFNARGQTEFLAELEIRSVADFHDPLSPLGTWVEVAPYGRCWHPARVEVDWRPYCSGHWEWTDVGWYWVSDEPWAWACYHYGSWVDADDYGWVWVPETDWAPAWVVWRESPDYIGWAPCAPGGVVVAAPLFVFADVHHFRDHFHRRDLIVNNPTIIRRTRVINHFKRERRDFGGLERTVFVNEGPGIDPIRRATGAKLSPTPVREVVRQTPVPREVRRKLTPTGNDQRIQPQSRDRNETQPRVFEERSRTTETPQRRPDVSQPKQPTLPRQSQPTQSRPTRNRERRNETPLPPTGSQGSIPQNPPQRTPRPPITVPERPVRPVQPELPTPAVPSERTLPPTGRGREMAPQSPPREVVPPSHGRAGRPPIRPAGPPPGQRRDRGENDQQ